MPAAGFRHSFDAAVYGNDNDVCGGRTVVEIRFGRSCWSGFAADSLEFFA